MNDDRVTTEHTQGVWTTCDACGDDWWCIVGSRDYLDEPETWICSGGCDDGWPKEVLDDCSHEWQLYPESDLWVCDWCGTVDA